MPEMVSQSARPVNQPTSYNNRVCVLREIFHILAKKAGLEEDPWEGVRLRPDDSHSRRELTMDELQRLLKAAKKEGQEWYKLFLIGIYTGLRLGDCCRLNWSQISIAQGVIQVVPQKTRRHHQRIVTIPIHQTLGQALLDQVKVKGEGEQRNLSFCSAGQPEQKSNHHCSTSTSSFDLSSPSPYSFTSFTGPVLPTISDLYTTARCRVSDHLSRIFKAAKIKTSVRIEGRKHKTPEATFHSLRHTFVSFAANAGVPLHIVQSIVGHESTAMTRHYYHENIDALKSTVAAIPTL